MDNSSFLNGDIRITGLVISNFGKQISVSFSLVCLSCCSLVHTCSFHFIYCNVLACEVDIVDIYH
jgi:hypothetical protein